jgi:hypothetical protein
MKNREILFKAKSLSGGKWIEGSLIVAYTNDCYIIDRASHIDTSDLDLGGLFTQVHPDTVCQLLNCGSGNFYEHDKVVYNGKEYIIKFNFSFATLERNLVENGENESVFIDEDVAYLMNVTGNIHD